MQKMGLEPTLYCYNRHLKPARLPIPPLLRTIDVFTRQRKIFYQNSGLKSTKNFYI